MANTKRQGTVGNSIEALGGVSPDAISKLVDFYATQLEKKSKLSIEKIQKFESYLRDKKNKEDFKTQKEQLAQLNRESNNIAKQLGQKLKDSFGDLGKIVNTVTKAFSSSIDQYISTYTRYMGTITTRLQGTSLTFNSLAKDVATNLSTSPYLRQDVMLENLNKFVESGISYNLESRAYIATATSKIATTFNNFDSSLLRIIRIQQADSTVARLGMESLLTKFLNKQYEDTSYLNQTSKNVSNLLLEAESLMGYKGASEFEYIVQRWLGSMSSLGVSENTISTIAAGLGYLGSGNISALSGNQALQNLLVMAASNAGLDYGSLLTGGLTGSSASRLLSSIVQLGQNIAGSGNYVVQSQYANLFGLNISDLVSLTNITANDLKAITSNIVNYENLRKETTDQLRTLSQRTTPSEMVTNVLANIMTSMGANVATNPALYGTWEVAKLLSSSGLDYTFNVGFLGTGTSFTLSQLMKTGVIGISGIVSLVNALGNIAKGNIGGTSLETWGERQTRGSLASSYGVSGRTVSGSAYLGSLDSSSLKQTFQENQEQSSQYTGIEEEDDTKEKINDINENVYNIYSILNEWDTKFMTSPFFAGLGGI